MTISNFDSSLCESNNFSKFLSSLNWLRLELPVESLLLVSLSLSLFLNYHYLLPHYPEYFQKNVLFDTVLKFR